MFWQTLGQGSQRGQGTKVRLRPGRESRLGFQGPDPLGINKCVLHTPDAQSFSCTTPPSNLPLPSHSHPQARFPPPPWGWHRAADWAGWNSAPTCRGGAAQATEGADRQTLPRAKAGATEDCGAEAQTGGRLGPEPGGAGGGLDPAGVPKAGHWMGVKAFQAEEERVQKHKYEGAVGHGASPWGSVGERIRKSQH